MDTRSAALYMMLHIFEIKLSFKAFRRSWFAAFDLESAHQKKEITLVGDVTVQLRRAEGPSQHPILQISFSEVAP